MKKALDTIDERLEKRERIEQEVYKWFSKVDGFTSEIIAWSTYHAMKTYDEKSNLTFRDIRDIMFEAAVHFGLEDWAFSD